VIDLTAPSVSEYFSSAKTEIDDFRAVLRPLLPPAGEALQPLSPGALLAAMQYLGQLHAMLQLVPQHAGFLSVIETLFAQLNYGLRYVYVMTGHPDFPAGWELIFRTKEATVYNGCNIFKRGFGFFKERVQTHGTTFGWLGALPPLMLQDSVNEDGVTPPAEHI
jgi:hypothetical protein